MMKLTAQSAAVGAAVAIVAVAASITEYRNHRLTDQVRSNTERLMTDPSARPDAWTRTQDDQRTAELKAWIQQEIARVCREQREQESQQP